MIQLLVFECRNYTVIMSQIEPKLLKGFRDQLPEDALERSQLIRQIETVFTSFGYGPIDTPALEYAEILLGKGGEETDKQLFRFLDNGDRDVALRFDLTVPLARYVAKNQRNLPIPFRRYHIAPVWRAEKPQKGRFREFMQCDIDLIGSDSTNADAEVVAVISTALSKINLEHKIKLNHRGISNKYFSSLGLSDKVPHILRATDKIAKIGIDGVKQELEKTAELKGEVVDKIFLFLQLSERKTCKETLSSLSELPELADGTNQLSEIIGKLACLGISEENLSIDLSIARGLDYYTGMVFETELLSSPEIGSIASGGRYDNLLGVYSKNSLPGVGASIGIDRILAALAENTDVEKAKSLTDVIVLNMGVESNTYCHIISNKLRLSGLNTELYTDEAKLGNQFKYADRKGIPFAIIAGANEQNSNTCALKNLKTKEQTDNISLDEAIKIIQTS